MNRAPALYPERGLAEVFTLQSHEISEHWRLIEPFLRRVEARDWTCEFVKDELSSARAQLWGFQDGIRIRGVWVTRLEGDRGLAWIAAGDDLENGLRLFREHTEPWLKSRGCKYVQLVGRRGWKKVLSDYEDEGIILVKDL